MDLNQIMNTTLDLVTRTALRALGALAIWIIGRWLIAIVIGIVSRALNARQIDPTLVQYARSTLGVLLNIGLVLGILEFFGFQVTTFAALIAAAGVAIGVAWGGQLQHFAAGVFLILLRPFRVGDFVTAGGVTGTVREIGLFVTTIDTPDNIRTIVGNGKIFSDTIQNFSSNDYRRVDLVAQLSGATDHKAAMQLLRERVSEIPHVLKEPAPVVAILEHRPVGPVLAVRPFTQNEHYWQVYFDTNRVIKEAIEAAGFPSPLPIYGVKSV